MSCLVAYLTLHDSFLLGRIKSDVVRVEVYDNDEHFKCYRAMMDGDQVNHNAMSYESAMSKAIFQTIETPNEIRGFLNELCVSKFNFRLFLFNCKCSGQQTIILTYSSGKTRRIGLAHADTLKFEDAFGDVKLTASSCDLARRIARNAELAFRAE